MKEVTRYACEHCDKHFSTKRYAEKHETGCWANPENRACRSCRNQKRTYVENENGSLSADGYKCDIEHGDGYTTRNCTRWVDQYEGFEYISKT